MHISELIMGYPYFRAKALLRATEFSSHVDHAEYQNQILAQLLEYVIREIPFYRERMGHLAGKISPFNALERLQQFPYVTKEDIQRNFSLLHKNSPLRGMKVKTGGSSGDCLAFITDRFSTRQREKAFIWNQWARVGYRPGDSVASFRGDVPQTGRLYDHKRMFNTYVFSSFDIVEERMESVLSALKKIRPVFLHGYPATMFQIAKLMKEYNWELPQSPRAVFCGSERMIPDQRKFIEEVFRSRVYSWYGHSECAALGGECEQSRQYHMFPQYGYVEFLSTDLTDETGARLYEIVATGFNNWVMPFVRYRTADYAIPADGFCTCGRRYPLIERVVGRSQEFLVGNEGELFSVTALTSQFEKLSFIDEFIFEQTEPGRAILSILPKETPSQDVLFKISASINHLSRGKLFLHVGIVDSIPKTTRGKRVYVNQGLDISKYLHPYLFPHESQRCPGFSTEIHDNFSLESPLDNSLKSRMY